MSDFVPQFRKKTPQKLSSKPWLDANEPQVILFQGMRGSGKGVAVDYVSEQLYHAGLNIWHIWGARSYENLYWAINKNCRDHYNKMYVIIDSFFDTTHYGGIRSRCLSKGLLEEDYEKYIEFMIQQKLINKVDDTKYRLTELGLQFHKRELLHCNCSKAYPIVWIVPDYIKIDQTSLDKFNGCFWKDISEYKQYFFEITSVEKKLLQEGNLRKPKEVCPKPLIIVKYVTPPTTSSKKETFSKQFTDIVVNARKERRIVVMNPIIFEGMDKFDTLTEIIRLIPYLMNKSGFFKPLTEAEVCKERKYWTNQQKSWHKVAIVINELRSVAPSSRLSGERDSSKSKKAIYDYVPEARHMKTWFLGDFQNPEDLYPGVRYQANVVVIKRASRSILGSDWSWLFDKIIRDRLGFLRKKLHKDIYRPEDAWKYEKHPKVRAFLDNRRPKIDELPDNKGYVTFPNGEIKLQRFEMPSFHHKTSLEDFALDTGIIWKIIKNKKIEETKEKSPKSQFKKTRNEILQKIDYMVTQEKKSFKQIRDDIIQMITEGLLPDLGYADKDAKYFNNMYLKWKKPPKLNNSFQK